MLRASVVAALSIAVSGCAGSSEPPVGVSTAPLDETGRSEPPPAGGGGYDFGARAEEVRATCGKARGTFQAQGRLSTCTERHESAGATRVTIVEYCDAGACRIHTIVVLDRPDAKTWLVAFEHLRRELSNRYGAADEQDLELPAECEKDFQGCLKSGAASAMLRWQWDDGHSIMLRLGATGKLPAGISVSYASSAAPARE